MSDDLDEPRGGVEGYCRKCGMYRNNLVRCEICNEWVCGECLVEKDPDEVFQSEVCRECAEDYSWELSDVELAEELADWKEYTRLKELEEKRVPVMDIILRVIKPRTFLKTPSGRAIFMVEEVNSNEVILSVGKGKWQIRIPAECLNGFPDILENKGWVLIGARHDQPSPEGSVDEYVKRFTHGVSAASYVVPILERILVVQVDRREPSKVRLIE